MATPGTSSSRKREREDESAGDNGSNSPITAAPATGSSGPGGTSSNFRNVSACNRCRHRKNRCDQQLPRCSACLKAGTKCVGFDPVSKREIPRSYVYYLETRVRNLEALVGELGGSVPEPQRDFAIDEEIKPGVNVPFPVLEDEGGGTPGSGGKGAKGAKESKMAKDERPSQQSVIDPALKDGDDGENVDKLVNNIGMVSVQGTSDSRYLGTTAGISFARVVFAAVKSSVSQIPLERDGSSRSSKQLSAHGATGSGANTVRDSFFGLHTRPTIKPAPFPEKALGLRLVELYFEHANPQIPILHRGEFMALFERVYARQAKDRTPRELYMLNIVFAIGSGIVMDYSTSSSVSRRKAAGQEDGEGPSKKRVKTSSQQCQPEEYHSSAIVHLESFLASSPASEGYTGGLEELQAVLLLAGLAVLRPVAPGLWYIIGVAVRLSVDLGLHFEDKDPELDAHDVKTEGAEPEKGRSAHLGRKQWTRDLRRRLWWCVYSFDRLVSTCVGRPFGITDQVITTEFPSLLDDAAITTSGFQKPTTEALPPTYKLVSHHYFRLRLLQSEILQVLQYRQAQQARSLGANQGNEFMHTSLPSPFLARFHSFREWRADVDRRLWEWKDSAPKQPDTGVAFTPLFLDLNYWQAVIMLYRQSLAVPAPLAEELSASTGEDVQSPGAVNLELKEDEQLVFLKVAQAGQTVLKLYRQLHRLRLVNYTFLATHHLFMSGISFLYALWHSPTVRSHLTLDDVDFTILAATSVLTDLIANCPPAEACRDAFTRMSKATISMCMSTTGFGVASSLGSQPLNSPGGYFSGGRSGAQADTAAESYSRPPSRNDRQKMPRFDMNLKDLFSEDELDRRPYARMQNFLPTLNQQASSSSHPQQQQQHQQTDTSSYTYTHPSPHSTTSVGAAPSPYQPPPTTSPTSIRYNVSNQTPYLPFAETISQQQPDFAFDNLDFLDTFPVSDPSGTAFWSGSAELDLGFGTGGTAGWEGGGSGAQAGRGGNGGWGDGGGVDLFDGFFFGNGNGGGGTF